MNNFIEQLLTYQSKESKAFNDACEEMIAEGNWFDNEDEAA